MHDNVLCSLNLVIFVNLSNLCFEIEHVFVLSDPPGSVKITPGNHTFYTKREGKPLHDIICEADCVPECTYWWYREGYLYPYTTGNNLFATNSYYYSGSSRFRCRVSNDIRPYSNLYSRSITVEVKGRIVYVYRFIQYYHKHK